MEYPQITSLVPEGEHFDASAINEGIYFTAGHVNSIEAALEVNATTLAAAQQEKQALETANGNFQTTIAGLNETIQQKDEAMAALQAENAELKKKPASEFSETSKEKDDHGSGVQPYVSEATKEANRLRAIRDGKK